MIGVLQNRFFQMDNLSGNILYTDRWNMGFLFVYDLTNERESLAEVKLAIRCVIKAEERE